MPTYENVAPILSQFATQAQAVAFLESYETPTPTPEPAITQQKAILVAKACYWSLIVPKGSAIIPENQKQFAGYDSVRSIAKAAGLWPAQVQTILRELRGIITEVNSDDPFAPDPEPPPETP